MNLANTFTRSDFNACSLLPPAEENAKACFLVSNNNSPAGDVANTHRHAYAAHNIDVAVHVFAPAAHRHVSVSYNFNHTGYYSYHNQNIIN